MALLVISIDGFPMTKKGYDSTNIVFFSSVNTYIIPSSKLIGSQEPMEPIVTEPQTGVLCIADDKLHMFLLTYLTKFMSQNFNIPYFRYYKTPLYLFLRPFGHSSRPKTRFFLVSLELLVRLLFKGVLYSRASYNRGNTVIG